MAPVPKRPLHRRKHVRRNASFLAHVLIPHAGNRYRPLLFTVEAVFAVVALVVALQGAYLLDTNVLERHTHFMASVLPSVLEQLTNADRQANGVGDLTVDPLLNQAAQLKADDMAANGYFAHVSPAGKTPWYWLDKVGYSYSYAGENLAVDFTDSKDVESAWMASPTHHANIVKAQYSRIGFGVADGTYQGHPTTFVVEEFATPRAEAAAPTPSDTNAPAPASAPAPEKTVVQSSPAKTETAPAQTTPDAPTQTAQQIVDAATSQAAAQAAQPDVLGAETSQGAAPTSAARAGFFVSLLASPTHAITFALGALAAILAILLIVTLIGHARVQYVEVVGTGLVMVSLILIVLVYNQVAGSRVVVPGSAQSAAVVNALP